MIRLRTLALVALAMLAAGCGDDATKPPPGNAKITGKLELELRETATVTIEPDPSDASGKAAITIEPSASYGLLGGGALRADGFVERYPEAGTTLYTAKLEAPAQSDGPCGEEPISLALALHRQGDNAIVVGGLSAYCGAGKHYGVPVRVLRLVGDLPL